MAHEQLHPFSSASCLRMAAPCGSVRMVRRPRLEVREGVELAWCRLRLTFRGKLGWRSSRRGSLPGRAAGFNEGPQHVIHERLVSLASGFEPLQHVVVNSNVDVILGSRDTHYGLRPSPAPHGYRPGQRRSTLRVSCRLGHAPCSNWFDLHPARSLP